MLENLKYSVLITVHNVEKYIDKCITSVLNQSYQNFEIIIINDGSTDSSGMICDNYFKLDKRIKIIHQNNKGLIYSRRKALSLSKGDYYIFLDSDDFWDENLLLTLTKSILKYDCDLVIFRYRKVDEFGNHIVESSSMFEDNKIFDDNNRIELFRKIVDSSELNNLVCKAIKNSTHDSTDYSNYYNIENAEDLMQSLPLYYSSKRILYLNKCFYNYRQNPNSMTSKFNKNYIKNISIVRGELLKYLNKMNLNDKKTLKLFYQFYLKSLLTHIISIAKSSLSKSEKQVLFLEIINERLFNESLKFYRIREFSIYQSVLLCLLNCHLFFLINLLIKLKSV